MEFKEQDLLNHFKELSLLQENLALLGWDELTGMPKDSADFRANLTEYIADKYFSLWNSNKTQELLDYFSNHLEQLSDVSKINFRIAVRNFKRDKNLTADDFSKLSKLQTIAQSKWAEARKQNNFNLYKTALNDLIEHNKKLIPKWRQNKEDSNYDVLLKMYESDFDTNTLNNLFNKVKKELIKIRQKINLSGQQIADSFLNISIPIDRQRKYVLGYTSRLGYDYNKGRLDDTIHPFMTAMNRNDARITTRWNENDFKMAVLGLAHEAGHGLFEQNIDPKFDYTPAEKEMAMSIHESQSLFNEVFIARNKGFLKTEFDELKKTADGKWDDIDFDTFYRAWNKTEPTLIRTEADPLTYPLHIIIRFEIEQEIFNNNLDIDELPKIWNEKYKEYLGIDVPDDLSGVLQDVHWAGGSFGYFPSYALGHFFAAQFLNTLNKNIDFNENLSKGNIENIFNWRKENIWKYGASLTPVEILEKVTGETLNVQYWLDYMKNFYYDIYQIKE
ncbi:MAG: carboxypeptidase M32 [Lactobacillaceae bacterium]|jgi:carboxypeptidase Taq|nr:carboxypeptidase M32 [Lactobacillaceae bacterium]